MLEQDRRQRVQKLLPLMKRIERTLTIQKGRQKRDESVTGKTKQEQHTMTVASQKK